MPCDHPRRSASGRAWPRCISANFRVRLSVQLTASIRAVRALTHADADTLHGRQALTMLMLDDGGGLYRMNDTESASKFNNLVSINAMYLQDHALTRIPSLKNLTQLQALRLAGNKITSIRAGDFKGADKLVSLMLFKNDITSVAPAAFADLLALRVSPATFAPKNENGTAWHDVFGIGTPQHTHHHTHPHTSAALFFIWWRRAVACA